MLIQEKLKMKEKFSTNEETIADYLMERGSSILKESVRDIANKTYTSPGSIVRLCQKMGFDGFQSFKEAYLKEIEYMNAHFENIDPNHPLNRTDKNMVIVGKIKTLYREITEDTAGLMNHDDLQKANRLLAKASGITLCVQGHLYGEAYIFKDQMLKIGMQVNLPITRDDVFYDACNCPLDHCFIIISYTGETPRPLMIAKKLKERGVPFMAITSFGDNTLSKMSDCTLHISTHEKLKDNLGHFSTNLSVHLILDVLYADYFNLNYEEHIAHKAKNSKEFEVERYSANPLMKD